MEKNTFIWLRKVGFDHNLISLPRIKELIGSSRYFHIQYERKSTVQIFECSFKNLMLMICDFSTKSWADSVYTRSLEGEEFFSTYTYYIIMYIRMQTVVICI